MRASRTFYCHENKTLRISPKRSTIARGGFEPSTLRVWTACSSQLSYLATRTSLLYMKWRDLSTVFWIFSQSTFQPFLCSSHSFAVASFVLSFCGKNSIADAVNIPSLYSNWMVPLYFSTACVTLCSPQPWKDDLRVFRGSPSSVNLISLDGLEMSMITNFLMLWIRIFNEDVCSGSFATASMALSSKILTN